MMNRKHEAKEAWVTPTVTELPRLTDLTLQSGRVIPGDNGGVITGGIGDGITATGVISTGTFSF